MITRQDFPYLTEENHRVTSPPSADYNCVAWSAADTEHWWQPGVYWPVETQPGDYGFGALAQAFETLGYFPCDDHHLEPGFEKVALYGSSAYYTHAARQLPDGGWTSKLGRSEDIEHETPHDLAGGVYGQVVQFMKRPTSNPAPGQASP
jgi:hypothetical protein